MPRRRRHSAFSRRLESRAGASRILTLESRFAGRDFPVYGGAVFVRADRGDLRTLADLRGKRLVTTGADAFGLSKTAALDAAAYVMTVSILVRKGP